MDKSTVLAKADQIADLFLDGFQWGDIAKVVRLAIEFAEIAGMSGADKRALAIDLLCEVIDRVDFPWLPDYLLDPYLKQLVPAFIDLVVDASKGRIAVNGGID